jgi:hypothetical protein
MNNPFFEFVIVIVLLSFIFKLLNAWLSKPKHPAEDPAKGLMLQRLEQLEERVRVLERIVTDERFDLKQQFKDLAS